MAIGKDKKRVNITFVETRYTKLYEYAKENKTTPSKIIDKLLKEFLEDGK